MRQAQSQCRKTEQEQNVEMPVPLISQQIVDVPVDVDSEILRHEKAIYQGHSDYAINDLKTNKEKLQQFEKRRRISLIALRVSLAGIPVKGANCRMRLVSRKFLSDIATKTCKGVKRRWRSAIREIQEKRELVQQYKRRRLGEP